MRYHAYGHLRRNGTIIQQPITAKEFSDAAGAKGVCLQAVAFEERIHLVVDNLHELECDLLRLAHKSLLWPETLHRSAMQERLLLDRRIINLLTASRLYLDHSAHAISDIFGKQSIELVSFKAETARLYDSRFGYRFMEALRNAVQHRVLAVNSITYTSGASGELFTEFAVKPSVEFEQLERDDGFKPAMLHEAKKLGKTLDLRGPIREYVSSLVELHQFSRKLVNPRFKQAVNTWQAKAGEYSEIDGKKVEAPTLVKTDDSKPGEPFEELHLFGHFLDYYDHLISRKIQLGKLRLQFASGGMIEPKELPTTIPMNEDPTGEQPKRSKRSKKQRPD